MRNETVIILGDLEATLIFAGGNVRVLCEGENVLLADQSVAAAAEIIWKNFEVVCRHFHRAAAAGLKVADVQRMGVSIVLHYLYIYNNWRQLYPKMADLDLSFREEDFQNPGTYDIIAFYCKRHYSWTWMEKAGAMLGKTAGEIQRYEEGRQLYYNR